jgi:predicted nucleotidyltransferase component of viral defense system
MPLTRPLILRHAGARQESYTPALLDVAQDHLLHLLHLAEVFERPGVVFKGGTSLRKCRIGHQGRFSTDLDLAVPNEDDVVDICETINGASIGGAAARPGL